MTQRKTDVNGWFEVPRNPLSRVGVFPYSGRSVGLDSDPDRIVRVYRPAEELGSQECLDSFKLLPWVDDHTMLGPDESSGHTPAERKGVHGVIGENVVFDNGVLYGNIKAFSNSLGRLIEAGKKQLSAGYRCVYDWTAGVHPEFGAYDCVQRHIRGNHLALVTEGRMGPSVAVQDHLTFSFDAQEAIAMADPKDDPKGGGGESMTLADAITMLKSLAPQVAALQSAFQSMSKPPAATPDSAAMAATAADAANKAVAAVMDERLKPLAALTETVAKLTETVTAMDAAIKAAPTPAAILADTASRDKLADRAAAVVGTFDHSAMTTQAVAEYACDKLELKPAKGQELVALAAYLTAYEKHKPATTVRTGMDAAPAANGNNAITRYVNGEAKAAA